MKQKVLLNWELRSDTGWGILGLNIFFHWANDPDIIPLMGAPIVNDAVFMVDPLRLARCAAAIAQSNDFLDTLGPHSGNDVTVIHGLGHELEAPGVFGHRNIGRCIFENTNLTDLEKRLARHDVLLCASNWNADLLRARTKREVAVLFEGIDPTLFCPGPKSGILDPRNFYVFSGGKLEFRKAQDLVLLAFKEFSRRHDNVYLVTAWHSPWPRRAIGLQGKLAAPLEPDANGMPNVKQWVANNDIDPGRVIEIFNIPNQLMPMILREIDVALQPSRAEACTNLPVMEAMACGIPVIVAHNTGMKDLITEDNCVPLRNQEPIAEFEKWGMQGWGESSVDEIIGALEFLYSDSQQRRNIGLRASEWIASNRTWQQHAAQLKQLILSLT